MDIIREDYILLARVPLSCRDCFSYHQRNGWPGDFCVKKQEYIQDCSCAYNCDEFVDGSVRVVNCKYYVVDGDLWRQVEVNAEWEE